MSFDFTQGFASSGQPDRPDHPVPDPDVDQGGAGDGFSLIDSAVDDSTTNPFNDFVDPTHADLVLPPGKPPLPLLIAPVVLAVIGGGLALWLRSLPALLLCWALAGPLAVILLGQFITKDQAARSRSTYLGASWVAKAPLLVGALIITGVCLTAFGIGRWAAYA